MWMSAVCPTAGHDFGREERRKKQWNLIQLFRQGAKQSSSVKKGSCPYKTCVRQLLRCTGVASCFLKLWQTFLFWAVEVPGPRSYPIALQELSWSGLEGRLQMQQLAAASADLTIGLPRLQRCVCCLNTA